MFTFNWYQDATLTYFSIGTLIDCHPYLVFVVVLDKKGENIVFIVLAFTLLLMINKKGEKDFEFEFYMHIYDFVYIKFNWYLEHVYLFF